MSTEEPTETGRQGDFWSQVPVVLFTVAAVVAIFLVNSRTRGVARPSETPAVPAATDVRLTPCLDCGEVIAIRPASGDGVEGQTGNEGAFLLDVRMNDGTVRSIKQFAPGFEVGDKVRVDGNSLVARG